MCFCDDFLPRDFSYEMGTFHSEKKKNREKDTGILIDNGVEFKPPMQYGRKKGKCDLKTY